jgi:Asp-tRNA(Asn)/Glu-tRNA(Gln) amidotransferase B subunit
MEYSIYFENDNANETISASLEELNNIFFIEISSSESEKNMLEDDENMLITSDDENFKNLNEINENLNNFEFVENSDNYIEDKVYDNLKLKVKEFFKNGKCSCKTKCYEKIGYE